MKLTMLTPFCFFLVARGMQKDTVTPCITSGHIKTIQTLLKKHPYHRDALQSIGSLATTDTEWASLLANKEGTREVLGIVAQIDSRYAENTAYNALLLNTPGSRALLADCVEKHAATVKKSVKKLNRLLHYICECKTPDLDLAKQIVTSGAPVIDHPENAVLVTAAASGNRDLCNLLLEHNPNLEIKDPQDERTALMAASLWSDVAVVKDLLVRGADVNAVNCFGDTALLWAAEEGRVDIVTTLLAANADVTKNNRGGETALEAAQRGSGLYPQREDQYNEIIKLLTAAGTKE
jgi:hypothetical protein